jgi:hypothetical protein
MRDHFCTPKALLEALKKSTLEGEEPDSTILELAKKAPTKTGAKKKALGDLQEQIYAKQNELNTLTTIKTYVNASEKAKQEASPIDAKTAEDYIRRIKEKQAKKELLNPKEKELLELNGKIMGMKLQISNALSETKKATLEKRRFDFEADAKRRVKLSDQTQKKLEALQAGGKELTDAEVYGSLLFDARKKNDAERLKEVRKEVKDLKAQQAKVLNEKKDALLEKLKKDPASITNEELSILETNAEKKVRLDIEKAQREQEKANKKIQKQLDTLEAKNSLLEALKNGDKESYLNDLQKKRFDAILKKENKTDLEKQLLAASKDLTKEKARIKQEHANIVFDALSNKENLTDDEQTVLNAIISKHKQELADKLDTYTNIETTQKKRLEALNKPIKTNPPEIEAQKKRVKDLNADLRNVFTDSYLRVSKADAEANGKQALVEAYKKGKFTDAEAEKLATNQHEINMRRLAGREGERTAYAKQWDKLLEEKGVTNRRTRQSIVDKLIMVARQNENGDGVLNSEVFAKVAKKLIKDQLAVSDAGIPNAVEINIRQLSKQIDELEASNKPEDIKYDEKALLQAKINAELSSLIKPTIADKINANIYLEPLLTVGSAVRDVLGSANAVLSEAYLNTMTRLWLGKTTVKQELANLKNLPENAKVEWGRIVDNWKRAGEYARQGLVVVSHDKVASTKLKPLFAYENKGFGSVKDSIESVGHWFEVAGNFRLNATDMYFMDTTFKHHIAQTIADGIKKDPNFKISKAQVEEAHQYANWAMFKEDNWLTNNVANAKQLLNNLGALPFEVQGKQASIPLGDLLMRYTRTPVNVGLRVFDITGLGDLRFIYANATKKMDDVPIYDKKALKPFVKSGETYSPSQVKEKATKGMVKLLTTGASSLAIGYWLGNTDVFSTGYTKENSDVEEAKGTRNDVYFNPQALMRFGSFKEEKGDVLVPLTPLLGQHVVGLRAVIRFAKGKDLIEGEKNAFGQAVDALATTIDVAGGTLGDATGITGIKQATKSWDALGGAVVERVPKPFGVGALGRDIATIADDGERITKAETPINTSVNRLVNNTPFKLLLPKKTDITGKNPKANGFGKALGFPFKIAKADPVIKELRQVSRDSGVDVQLKQVDNNFRIGKTLAEDYGIEPQNMKLNAQDFAKWQEIHNNMVYQSVKSVVESKDYKSLTDPLDKADEIKYAKENPFVVIDGKDYTPKELFLEYKLKGRVVKIEK